MRLHTAGSARKLVLLPPQNYSGAPCFGEMEYSASRYSRLLEGMQHLRGRVYLEDGAINASDLLADGRHRQSADYDSWHLLVVDGLDRVKGCARYRSVDHSVRFRDLGVAKAEIAHSGEWGIRLHQAVQREIWNARERNLGFVEVGGWALDRDIRLTSDALKIALSMWALAQNFGGCIGITTATVRHCSSTILRKIGGSNLVIDGLEIPRYFDQRYCCDMEILRFDSSQPNIRFKNSIDQLGEELKAVTVVSAAGQLGMVAQSAGSYASDSGFGLRLATANLI